MNLTVCRTFVVFFVFSVISVTSDRILGIVSAPSYSHQVVFNPLWKELSLKGHQVTVLTTNPVNDSSLTNLTEIDLHFSYKLWNEINTNDMARKSIFEMFDFGLKIVNSLLDAQLSSPDVQILLKNETEHFDLLIVETLFPTMVAFSERFKCPFIQLVSRDAPAVVYHTMGNPAHPIVNPDYNLPFSTELTFVQRLKSTFSSLIMKYYTIKFNSVQSLLVEKHFGHGYPSINDILKKSSMLFVNTDLIFHQIRPLVPTIVQIGGGTHLKPPRPLPKNLKQRLDNAKQGFIYFSLGTNVKSKYLSENTRDILLQTFAELPYVILWKFELEDLPGKPDNVIISKWFPQADVFRHKNIKLFITQGGLQSLEEAVYNHIPIIGMPFLSDQHSNVNRMVSKGIGLSVNYNNMDKASLKNAILEVINNPTYRHKVKELAELARDQPMTGLERAVWWTEYVLRHKGTKHLRSPVLDLPLYQYFLLDVISFCLIVVLVVFYVVIKLIKITYRLSKYFLTKTKVKVL